MIFLGDYIITPGISTLRRHYYSIRTPLMDYTTPPSTQHIFGKEFHNYKKLLNEKDCTDIESLNKALRVAQHYIEQDEQDKP